MASNSYSAILTEKMNSRSNPTGQPVSIRKLSELTGRTYEHCRRILRGAPVMGRSFSDDLARVLGLDADRLWQVAQNEKLRSKYSDAMTVLPKDERLVAIWLRLTREERSRLISVGEALLLTREAEKAFVTASS
jgi:hypothetical protein